MISKKARRYPLMDLSFPLGLQTDIFFQENVITPTAPKIAALLQSRKMRGSKKIRQLIFVLLAETDHLRCAFLRVFACYSA